MTEPIPDHVRRWLTVSVELSIAKCDAGYDMLSPDQLLQLVRKTLVDVTADEVRAVLDGMAEAAVSMVEHAAFESAIEEYSRVMLRLLPAVGHG